MGVIIDGHVEKIKRLEGEYSKMKRENQEYRLELASKEEIVYSMQAKVQKYEENNKKISESLSNAQVMVQNLTA